MIDPLLYPADVAAHHATLLSLADLAVYEERERGHPKRLGGRRTVLEACAERRASLEALAEWREEHPPWIERPLEKSTHYTCSFCGLGFLARPDIEEHQRQQHPQDLATYGPAPSEGLDETLLTEG